MWHVSQGRYQRAQQSIFDPLTEPTVDILIASVLFLLIGFALPAEKNRYSCDIQNQSSLIDFQTTPVLVSGSRLSGGQVAVDSLCSRPEVADEIEMRFLPGLGHVATWQRFPDNGQPDSSLLSCTEQLMSNNLCRLVENDDFVPERKPRIHISKNVVALERELICGGPSTLEAASTPWKCFKKLTDELALLRRNWMIMHPDEPFASSMDLILDRNADFEVVQTAINSAHEAGYRHIEIEVALDRPWYETMRDPEPPQ